MVNKKSNGIVVVLLAFIMIFTTVIVCSGDNVAFAKNKYSKYKGYWSGHSGKYESVLTIKKISKNKIKGEISANNWALMGKQEFYERIYKFSNKIIIKNSKTKFSVKLKNGDVIKVKIKFGKVKKHKDYYSAEKAGYKKLYGLKVKIKYNKRVWKHFNKNISFMKSLDVSPGGC